MADTNLNYTLRLKDFFKKTMVGAQNETSRLDGGMNKLGKTANRIGGAIVAAFAFDRIKDFAVGVVMATAAMTSFSNAVIASSRTEGEGRANLSFLNKQVDRLGLNLDAAQKGYKTFTGAVMGSNIQGAKSNKIFRQVSEASAVLGLSAEQTEGSFLALGQMISKGTVQAEELRGQLAERIPGAFQIGARAMGMTSKQLGEAMKAGLVNSEEFLIKFGDELERTFGTKLGAATNSLQANLNRMSNEWQRLQVNIGNSQSGLINSTINWSGSILKNFNEVVAGANKVDAAFKTAGISGYNWLQSHYDTVFLGTTNKFINDYITGGKGRDAMLQRSLQGMYVDPSTRSKADAFGAEAGLLRLRSGFSKSFANKDIGKREYEKGFALISAALAEVKGNQLSTGTGTDKPYSAASSGPAVGSIGSPVEVSGARPQNITINVDKLVETLNITSQTMEGGAKQAAGMTKKAFLELLNDANTIANR